MVFFETVWEAPDKFYTMAQYASRIAQTHDPRSAPIQSNDDSEHMRPLPASQRVWSQEKQERASEMHLNGPAPCADLANTHELNGTSKEISADVAEIPTPGSYLASATADYYTAPFVDGAAIAAAFRLEDHEIPLPPSPRDSHISAATKVETTSEERKELSTKVKEELKDDDEHTGEKAITAITEFKVKNEPMEDAKSAATSNERPRLPLRIGRSSPYGEWRKVEKPVEKKKIDYELPTEEEGRKTKKEEKIRPEDIIEFGEKSAPLSRKRAKDETVRFKRRKRSN
uniref:Matrin-type domain-containing protein n=1 Tax=Parascaris univalens TaxID=6257 RepID=A0A915C9G1_PARUN